MSIKKISTAIIGCCTVLCACNALSNEQPSQDKMKECLGNELANKAIIESYEQQDGLKREKDGVKYYEGYFNAEIKFIANYNNYKAGEQYKIIKGTVSFMKTDNGWNCQGFDMSAAKLVEIKQQAESAESPKANQTNSPKQELNKENSTPAQQPSNNPSISSNNAGKKYIAVIDDADGFTNVRAGMSVNTKIIDKLFEGEHFEVFPSADSNWWIVYTQSNVKGYVYKSHIRIIN